MSKYEVTNGQYRRFRPAHDSQNFQGRSLNGDPQPVQRQQSLQEGLRAVERFITEGNRHDAELAFKLLSRLDLDEARLAELEARVRKI